MCVHVGGGGGGMCGWDWWVLRWESINQSGGFNLALKNVRVIVCFTVWDDT